MRHISILSVATIVLATAAIIQPPSFAQGTPPSAQAQATAPSPLAFDVASVKRSAPGAGMPMSSLPLTPGSTGEPKGGLFQAKNWPLLIYISFAYNIQADQLKTLTASLPPWALSEPFDIEARADGSPTRDQMRAMMRSLLEDRFALKLHTEKADRPIFALVLAKPGKTGPQLQPHGPDAPPCPDDAQSSPFPFSTSTVAGGFPAHCGSIVFMPSPTTGSLGAGGRNITMDQVASAISATGGLIGGLDKPVEDQTGLTGKWDFVINFAAQPPAGMPGPMRGPMPGAMGQQQQSDDSAPTFLEALTDQLGLKLINATGPVEQLVIDHIQEPSPN